MLASEFDFHLPPELIAQTPAEPRDHSRLMVVHRDNSEPEHRRFHDLPSLLRADDLLVFNDTRVIRARLRGHKTTGGAVEALLLREIERNLWEVLLRPSARLKAGVPLEFVSPDGELRVGGTPEIRTGAGWLLRFASENDIRTLLPNLGEVPIPPYIRQAPRDESQYQTVYARTEPPSTSNAHPLDSSAAPTAGLHFTPHLLEELRAKGIEFAFVTLGIGLGTFRSIQSETLEEHKMHEEEFEISEATSAAIARQRERGARVIAVGTTAARVLESVGNDNGLATPQCGATRIFITPGYQFKIVDALLTNFHLPRSTLLAMVSAFAGNALRQTGQVPEALAGLDRIRYAYRLAVTEHYRFFSFGDAMFIE